MKKVICVILCLVFILAFFVMPSSAYVVDGSTSNSSQYGSGGGSFSPLNCFTVYRHLQGAMSVDSPFPYVSPVTLSTWGGDPQYVLQNANTTPARFPNVTALYGTKTPYSLERPINNITISSNSYLGALSSSFSLCRLGEKIEFSLSIFVRHNSGRNNTLLTSKTVSCTFRPYNGLRFYTSAEFPEIACDTSFEYMGLVENAPDYEADLWHNDAGPLPKCSYDYYRVKFTFDYSYDLFSNTSMGTLPPYGFYGFYLSLTWSKPVAATAAFYTPVLLGDLEVSRWVGGYPVDIDGNIISTDLNTVLDTMNQQTQQAFRSLGVARGEAGRFLTYATLPLRFFNNMVGSFFGYMPVYADLAYGLIFLSLGMILFGFVSDAIPSFVSKGRAKVNNAARSYRARRQKQAKDREDVRKHLK